jgi:hypothetical protein
MKSDHNKVIDAAAKKLLKPMGLQRQGKSRVWLDDHGWWMTQVEFQPSSWSKGSYLNVGVCWLLYEGSHHGFNVGYRVDVPFIEANQETDFESEMNTMAQRAKEEVLKYREDFSTLAKAADYYLRTDPLTTWDRYYGGVILGLCNEIEYARKFLGAVAGHTTKWDWERALAQRAADLLPLLPEHAMFMATVKGIVLRTRSIGHLPDITNVDFGSQASSPA